MCVSSAIDGCNNQIRRSNNSLASNSSHSTASSPPDSPYGSQYLEQNRQTGTHRQTLINLCEIASYFRVWVGFGDFNFFLHLSSSLSWCLFVVVIQLIALYSAFTIESHVVDTDHDLPFVTSCTHWAYLSTTNQNL